MSATKFSIVYQPIVRLEDRSIAALKRWRAGDHPKLGRRSPAEFIAIAEETGLIVELGNFMLERTARQLLVWQRSLRSHTPLFCSVNVVFAAVTAARPSSTICAPC